MAATQEFKTKVVFGGRIDPSFSKSADGLKQAINNTSKTLSKLTKEQWKLKEKIAATKLAGKDVSGLARQYEKLDRNIKEVTSDHVKLNQQLKKQQTLEKWKGRAKGAAKWGGQAARGIGSGVAWGAAGGLGIAAGAAAGALAMNAETSEKLGLARSYGVGVEKYSAWENVGKAAGLNGENIGDLSEELTNKLGEAGNEKTVDPMLFQIGLSKKRMAGWSREKQFNEVMSRISKMKDEKQAASLADQLMGGEANKIMTYMRATGKTWEETMAEAEKSNLLTKEGAEGAARAHFSVTNLWSAITSGLADTLGKVSGQLAPTFDNMRDTVIQWFHNNQGTIVDTIKAWVTPEKLKELWGGVVSFGEGCVKLGKIIWALANKLEWLIPDEKSANEETAYNNAYQSAYKEFMDNGGMYAPNAGLAADQYAKMKAEEAAKEARNKEEYAQSDRLDTDALKQAFAFKMQAPQQNNKIEINIVGATDPAAVQQSAAAGVLEGLRKSNAGYNPGSMFDVPIASG
ncbi:hypothetical protein ETB55_21790 [Salmonella enterica subsp. enterica serovar Omuna]|nr:hypothetical protein [Salmonella enterica subsp. enterica serovar Omuna]